MLKMSAHRRRRNERGQTLVLALAFIAFFGVVIVAVLRVGEVTGLQHVQTEATALKDGTTEGGAAYAAADAGRTDVGLTCAPGNSGQLTMQAGQGGAQSSVDYLVKQCNPGLTGVGGTGTGPGQNCILCVLNVTSGLATTTVVSLACAQCTSTPDLTTSGGDIYVNGSISSGSSMTATATAPNTPHIRFLSGASYAGCVCSPAPTTYAPAIGDPLLSTPLGVGAPSAVAGKPTGCPNGSYDAADGCSIPIPNNGTTTINPGLWSSLSIGGQADVVMNSGVYVFTHALTFSGKGSLKTVSGGWVTIFLTCPGYGPSGTLCTSPRMGGSVDLTGQGSTQLNAPTEITAPNTQYAAQNIAILADPNLRDADTGKCMATGKSCVFASGGQGHGISGTVDLRASGISLQGNGGATITGRLITNSLNMQVSGNVGSGLNLSGNIAGINTSACGVFDANVWGSGTAIPTGRAVVQSQCGTSGPPVSGVVTFNYTP